jgi:DNA polymerase elongation subunit (family B)
MSTYPDDVLEPLDQVDELPPWDDLPGKRIDPYVDITGFEYVRGDSAVITGQMQKRVFQAILMEDATKDEISEIVNDFYERVRSGNVPVLDACRGPSIKKKEDYKQVPIQARAGYFTDRFFESVNIQAGDDVYYVYVKSTGYNHQGRKLPEQQDESSKVIGMVEDMDPPQAKITCNACGEKWTENEFGRRIQDNSECPGCGISRDDTEPEDPFDVDGCYADWDKIANRVIKDKSQKLLKHIGWDDICESLGQQDTFASF